MDYSDYCRVKPQCYANTNSQVFDFQQTLPKSNHNLNIMPWTPVSEQLIIMPYQFENESFKACKNCTQRLELKTGCQFSFSSFPIESVQF